MIMFDQFAYQLIYLSNEFGGQRISQLGQYNKCSSE